jgi:hypothetical protein
VELSKTDESPDPTEETICKICRKSFRNQEELDHHSSSIELREKPLTVQTQYDRIAQDWRQVHTIVWGIPNIAVAIFTGIVIGAYQLEGVVRIIVLSAGAILLFALSVELVEKRVFMNAISARMHFMEKYNHLEPFDIRKLEVTRELNKYNIEIHRSSETDVPYRLFRWFHARAALTYVVFVTAIFLAGLSFWEFVKFLNYAEYSYLAVIPIVIICAIIAKSEILGVEGRAKCSNIKCRHAKEFHYPDDKYPKGYCLDSEHSFDPERDECNCKEFGEKIEKKDG